MSIAGKASRGSRWWRTLVSVAAISPNWRTSGPKMSSAALSQCATSIKYPLTASAPAVATLSQEELALTLAATGTSQAAKSIWKHGILSVSLSLYCVCVCVHTLVGGTGVLGTTSPGTRLSLNAALLISASGTHTHTHTQSRISLSATSNSFYFVFSLSLSLLPPLLCYWLYWWCIPSGIHFLTMWLLNHLGWIHYMELYTDHLIHTHTQTKQNRNDIHQNAHSQGAQWKMGQDKPWSFWVAIAVDPGWNYRPIFGRSFRKMYYLTRGSLSTYHR